MMMSFVSDCPAPGQVDPRNLTPGQLAALRTIRDFRLARVKGGWQCAGSPKVTLATAAILGVKRLVTIRNERGRMTIAPTGTGLNTLAVADERSRRHG